MSLSARCPVVLAIGGHDPSGGAGLQADIETIAAHGCRALSIVTTLTAQNTCGVLNIYVQSPEQVELQCRLVLEETKVAVAKIGLIGDAKIAWAIARVLTTFPNIAVVLDPVLAAGHDGISLADNVLQDAILEQLSPHCLLMTPNSLEARILGKHDDLAYCANAIIAKGTTAVLITGTHESSHNVINRLYGSAGVIQEDSWPRLPGNYHGSGCTLASAVAARLALGSSLTDAVYQAQTYTWQTLQYALHHGRCQLIPNRFFGTITNT